MSPGRGRPPAGISPYALVEPFIEQRGERGRFWLRKPRNVGERLVVARDGSTPAASAAGRAVIRLAAGSAFGTGGHGSTEGCLVAIEQAVKGGETVLDLGTGSGILAIAATVLGASRVAAIDLDRAACAEARKNIASNGVGDRIDVVAGGIESVRGTFDVVVANLRTHVLLALIDEIDRTLAVGGTAILSGILERELHGFLPCLERRALERRSLRRIGGWLTLSAVKGSSGLRRRIPQ